MGETTIPKWNITSWLYKVLGYFAPPKSSLCRSTSVNSANYAASRFEQEVELLSSSPWKILTRISGKNTVFLKEKDTGVMFIGHELMLPGVLSEERWELFKDVWMYKAKLKCPFVRSVVDVVYDQQKDCLIVVMEHCEGGSLLSVVAQARKHDDVLNDGDVQDWLVEIIVALDHLHAKGITHGQINCREILLKENNVRLNVPSSLKRIFQKYADKNIECTPSTSDRFETSYTAPEVLTDNTITTKSDLWSVGCVLYELCTLKRLFSGRSTEEIRSKILTSCRHRLPTLYSYELEEMLNMLLIVDPLYRPSATDCLQMPCIGDCLEDMDFLYKNTSSADNRNWLDGIPVSPVNEIVAKLDHENADYV